MTQDSIRMPMETIRIVIEAELLREIDQIAMHKGISRDALICDALREYIKRERIGGLRKPRKGP